MEAIEFIGLPELKAKLSAFPEAKRIGLRQGMLRALIFLQSYIKENKLHGNPLKSHQGEAGLAGSINYAIPVDTQDDLVGQVGTNKVYAPVHEYGGTFDIREHTRQVTQVFGRALASPITATVRAHTATYPERSFMRSSLAENTEVIREFLREGLRGA